MANPEPCLKYAKQTRKIAFVKLRSGGAITNTKTLSDIKVDINETVKKYIPNLIVNDVIVERDEEFEHKATIKIDYTVTEDVFEERDIIVINI